jgi:hypothetical protein
MKKLILILCEPRTGSNLLNEAMNLYIPIRAVNEFFLNLGFYVREDFVPDDLLHKTLIKDHERKQLFDFLNVEQENYPELIKQINRTPIQAVKKLYEIIPGNLVIKIHRHQLEELKLHEFLELPYVEVILLERSNRLDSYVSLLKAKQFDKWHNVDTSNIKVSINIDEFIYERDMSFNWYKEMRQRLSSKDYLEVNYELDLENINKESFYALFDPWFERIKLPVYKSNYELQYFSKQNKSPVEQSILNLDEIKHLII